MQADQLKSLVGQLSSSLQERIPIYPGSDETQMILFSKFITVATFANDRPSRVLIGVVYRDPATKDNVPNYEGEPMATTLKNNILAGGGDLVELADVNDERSNDVDLLLFVNNFSVDEQLEASQQPPYDGNVFDVTKTQNDRNRAGDSDNDDYKRFDAFI